ncbi:sigma-70 family RNA polymerase sigma factor [Haliovirga abyssi]|uniref:RNA polymerase sigma factor n=1 Tax=Haliovirga abyssi TaxID=2996794 RepID=A0AAU9D3V6_9FUSO|nr:RNA polymerase sigma factor RpoD/SigA [Haliovirga abyssi]BDU50644.1 hypothetical protein HLVA_12130 [Haliovirga abyssi]
MKNAQNLIKLYLSDIKDFKLLTKEEEYKLIEESKKGNEEAKEELILSNLKLVIKIAKGYRNKGLSFMDLISEGNIGLIYAIEKFDLSRGFRFSTYAVWWIKQTITKSIINKGRGIRIPSYKHDILNKINMYIGKYLSVYDKYPSPEEISEELNLDKDKVHQILIEFQDMVSLSTSVGEDIFLEDIIPEKESEMLEDDILDEVIKENISKEMEILNERERDIVISRFGMGGIKPLTLEELGKKYDITRERVRQIEKKALKKLKSVLKKDLLGLK